MRASDIFLAVLVAFAWGFNFVVIAIGLDAFPPIFFSALRFASAAFPAVLIWDRGKIAWRWIVSIGVVLGIVMFSLLFVGIDVGMPAGLASLVLQVQAVFTLMLTGLALKDPPGFWQKIGIAVAFAGIGLLAAERFETASFAGLVLVVAAGFAWAVSNILMKLSGNIDMFRLIVWMSLVPPVPLFLISLVFETGQGQAIQNISWLGIGAVLYAGLVSTVFAYGAWGWLVRRYSPNVVAPFSLLVPISGVFSSFAVLGERLTAAELLSSLVVFAGLCLIVFGARLAAFVRAGAGFAFRR